MVTSQNDQAHRERSASSSTVEVELLAERLRVEVERVPREVVRISKRIRTETLTLEVPVRFEELVVEHLPVASHEASLDGTSAPEPLVLVLHREVPEVTTRVVAVEKVTVRVISVEGIQEVHTELRTEEAVVDQVRASAPTPGG